MRGGTGRHRRAGSADCTIAARLSEDPATRALRLEAGSVDTNRRIHIPLGFGKTFADPSVNWRHETEVDASGRKVSSEWCFSSWDELP